MSSSRLPAARSSTCGATLVLAAALAFAGCGKSATEPGTPLPPVTITPENDTPANLMLRFEHAYEQKARSAYRGLFTADFRFHFSLDADPDLVLRYGTNWKRTDEDTAAAHLFSGFTTNLGESRAPASLIALTLSGAQFIGDPDHADSAAYYRLVLVPTLLLTLEIPNTADFEISAPHDFHLVRGDAAVLDASQAADSSHWYIRSWEDRTVSLGFAGRIRGDLAHPLPASPTTWGKVKVDYR